MLLAIKFIVDKEYLNIITDFRNIGHMPEGRWVGLLFMPESVALHDTLLQT